MSGLSIAISSIGENLTPGRILRNTIAAMPAHLRIAGVEELLQISRQDPEPEERLIADLEVVLRGLQAESAEAVAQTSPPPTATEAAVQLPPQLAAALGDNAARVADMCFLAPGVPWSNQLLDDILADLRYSGSITFLSERGGVVARVMLMAQVQLATRRRPRTETLLATIYTRRSTDAAAQMSLYRDLPDQSFNRAGLRKMIEWCQENVNNVHRRGFCNPCLDGQRPAKRLRVSGSQVCSTCLLGQSM